MADSSSGEKEKLTITACKVDANGKVSVDVNNKGQVEFPNSRQFKFALNPEKYERSFAISYSDKSAIGQSAANPKFSGVGPETLKISTMIDTTGATGDADANTKDLKTQLEELSDIVYKYDGKAHEPNPVQVLWGSQIFIGRLKSMTVDNTLFKASGEPLRAKLQLEFKSFVSNEEAALKANPSSPDMSHLVEVKAGDTLPLLCYQIYRDSSYYLEVARHNNVTDFRNLEPGSKLHFPPLR